MAAETCVLRDLEALRRLASTPVHVPRAKTMLEVLGVEARELSASALLAFFLDPREAHDLGDLMLRTLLGLLPAAKRTKELLEIDQTTVRTEVVTEDGTRIDVFVEAETFCLCIENKLLAPLYNRLETYSTFTEHRARATADDAADERDSICVVLALEDHSRNPEVRKHGFNSVTYEALFERLAPKVAEPLGNENGGYRALLADFIETIRRLGGGNEMNVEFLELLRREPDVFRRVARNLDAYERTLRHRVDQVRAAVEGESPAGSRFHCFWPGEEKELYDSAIFRVYVPEGFKIDLGVRLSPDGWTFRLHALGTRMDQFQHWLEARQMEVQQIYEEDRFEIKGPRLDWDDAAGAAAFAAAQLRAICRST